MSTIVDVRDYDMGMLKRFQFFYPNTVWINHSSVEISEIRDNAIYEGQDIHFPVLILRRTSCPVLYRDNSPYSQYKIGDRHTDGMSQSEIVANGFPDDMTLVNSIYELKYDLEILSASRDNFDELVIEAQENLIRFPFLTIDADDKVIRGQSSHLLMDTCQDNSDLDNFGDHVPLYRATIGMTLRGYIYRKYRRFSVDEFLMHLKVNSKLPTDEDHDYRIPTVKHINSLVPENIRKILGDVPLKKEIGINECPCKALCPEHDDGKP